MLGLQEVLFKWFVSGRGRAFAFPFLVFVWCMATIKEVSNNITSFIDGFEKEVRRVMDSNKSLVREFVTEQLYSGVDGNDNPIRPTYLNDPWFKTEESGKWRNNAKGYANMKKRITRPTPSFQGYPARNIYTPNLIITGEFYDSIRVSSSSDGLKIETRGSEIGPDIERKYGSIILGIGDKSREYFLKYVLNPALRNYFSKFGLL